MTYDRLLDAVRIIVRELVPNLQFAGVWEYRVNTWQNDTITCTPVAESNGLPACVEIPMTPPITGGRSELAEGSVILIGFTNMDPSRPYVANADPNTRVKVLRIEASQEVKVDAPTVTVTTSGTTSIASTDFQASGSNTASVSAGTKASVSAPLVDLGSTPVGGVATSATLAPGITALTSALTALSGVLGTPGLILPGPMVPIQAAIAAAVVALSLPTQYSQTVKAQS